MPILATITPTRALVARTLTGNPNPTTPPFTDDQEWITAYLAIHMLSDPSRRYSYLLWLSFALVFVGFSIIHLCNLRAGVIGAYFSKWAIRRRTWKSGSRKPGKPQRIRFAFPSNAHIASLAVLTAVVAVLTVVGPDYITPSASTLSLATRWDPLDFVGYAPQYTIPKAWWTAGGRSGMMAFALFPLCVLFALKAAPFAVFAIPHLVHLSFDKLSFLHRYSAYLIWLLSAAHTALWSVQLFSDRRTSAFADSSVQSPRAYTYAWSYTKFIYAWTAFGLLTLLLLTTVSPLRKYHYETFYFLHILLVPMTLAMAALHHPPLWWWCWAALGLWVGERAWRSIRWLFKNGYMIGKVKVSPPRFSQEQLSSPVLSPRSGNITPFGLKDSVTFPLPSAAPSAIQGGIVRGTHYPPQPSSFSPTSPTGSNDSHDKRISVSSSVDLLHSSMASTAYIPPPGFAHAELVAGYTIRLTFTPARPIAWAPGQYFLVQIPAISRFLSHPFTCASCYDDGAPAPGGPLVFLVRAKAGWTRDLGALLAQLQWASLSMPPGEALPIGWAPPRRGAVMRMCIDGPFGSTARVRWGDYATAVIFAGGSGVSFGLSILEHLCMRMADPRGFRVARVRFVWIVREYSHLQWCAATIRRCMETIPPPGLQVDICVTNATPEAVPRHLVPPQTMVSGPASPAAMTPNSAVPLIEVVSSPNLPTLDPVRPMSSFAQSFSHLNGPGGLAPPTPRFAGRPMSGASAASEQSNAYSAFDLSYYAQGGGSEDEEFDAVDFTHWAGEDDTAMPGERRLSRQVEHAGTKRRSRAWRRSMMVHATDNRTSAYTEQNPLSAAPSAHSFTRAGVSLAAPRDARTRSGGIAGLQGRPQLHSLATPMSSSAHLLGVPEDGPSAHSALEPPMLHGHSQLVTGASSTFAAPHGSSRLVNSFMPSSPVAEASDDEADEADDASITIVSPSRPDTPASGWDPRSSVHSAEGLFTPGHVRSRSEVVRLDVAQREMRDLAAVSQFAGPGRPRLDALLHEEAARSRGPLVVACCGPGALNTSVRKAVAAQIDPAAVRRGDMRGAIALVSEEYEY